jgi:hypothetical protein
MTRALVALAVLGLALAGSAAARPPLELGVQDDALWVGLSPTATPYLQDRGFAAARSLRMRHLRVNVLWKRVETAPGVYDWSLYDATVDAARTHGMGVQLTLTGPAPAWATADGRTGVDDPDPYRYGAFAGAAAAHFRGRVSRYAIWNEPNWPSWLQPTSRAAAIYRGLYQQGYRAVKQADPRAQVLFGELAPMGPPEAAIRPLTFLRNVACVNARFRRVRRCAPLRADGFAHHPYTLGWSPSFPGAHPDDVTMGSLIRLRVTLSELARRRALATPRGDPPPLYLTEYAYHADSWRISPARRADYAVDAYRRALAEPGVRQMVWYHVVAPPPNQPKRVWDTALLDNDGAPRPTYEALLRWTRSAAANSAIERTPR